MILCSFVPFSCYSDFLGMYAFGLEETNFYKEAEETARKVNIFYTDQNLKPYINIQIRFSRNTLFKFQNSSKAKKFQGTK